LPHANPRLRLVSLVAASLFAALATGCASTPTSTTLAGPASTPAPAEGRTTCPGSVLRAETDLTGAPADALEQLQATYEDDPGFLAVVFDGTKPVVVVESARLAEWQLRLLPSGVAVARSCIDPALLAAVHAGLPLLPPVGGMVSAGYDGLDDTIFVLGVDAETLVRTVDGVSPGAGRAARDAIADGTLRIDPSRMPPAP
jgi:hypothetical protein